MLLLSLLLNSLLPLASRLLFYWNLVLSVVLVLLLFLMFLLLILRPLPFPFFVLMLTLFLLLGLLLSLRLNFYFIIARWYLCSCFRLIFDITFESCSVLDPADSLPACGC
jgi:hypothetical protein